MSASFSRSICTHCLPGPSSTHEPSSPALSPSVTRSKVPTIGLLSLAVTFLPLARLMVPAGTKKSGRLPFIGGSRFGTFRGTGVPTKRGRGSCVFSGILSCARAPVATSNATTSGQTRESIVFIISGIHFFLRDQNLLLGAYRLVGFVNDIFARESLVGGTVQLCRATDRVEEVFQVGLVRGVIDKHGNLVLRQLRC